MPRQFLLDGISNVHITHLLHIHSPSSLLRLAREFCLELETSVDTEGLTLVSTQRSVTELLQEVSLSYYSTCV